MTIVAPTVTTGTAAKVGTDKATLRGSITDTGGENCDIRGFDYGLTTDYGSEIALGGSFEAGSFSQIVSGLEAGATYHFRAKAHNS